MFCIPTTTDWACTYSESEIATMRTNDADTMHRAEALAWTTLARLAAYQIGVCPDTVRPWTERCPWGGTWMQAVVNGAHTSALPLRTIGLNFTPYVSGGNWVNGCACGGGAEVVLPGPVGAIVEVKANGVVVAPAAYHVENGVYLVRDDGDIWPACDQPFEVTYYRGAAPNELTNYAAGVLAAEFFKACKGDKKCRLPAGTVSVVRGNTTIELEPNLTLALGRIPEVQAVVDLYNPNHLKAPPRVISPDSQNVRRPTWRY